MAAFASLADIGLWRHLREIPQYTSPATEAALEATPLSFRDNEIINAGRLADAEGNCAFADDEAAQTCQILFPPAKGAVDSGSAKLGVVFFPGGLVDPRGYSELAEILSDKYGLAVAVQIFDRDIAFKFGSSCDSGRLGLASYAFPEIEKWVLAGHSLGGITAVNDLWSSALKNETDKIAGLALLASYVRQDLGCGDVDFSDFDWMPAASVSATLDGVINTTNWNIGTKYLPGGNETFYLDILGGNHRQFGSYDDSERGSILGQSDGNATIPYFVQLDLSAAAIAHVASRSGVPMPTWRWSDEGATTSGVGRRVPMIFSTVFLSVVLFNRGRMTNKKKSSYRPINSSPCGVEHLSR